MFGSLCSLGPAHLHAEVDAGFQTPYNSDKAYILEPPAPTVLFLMCLGSRRPKHLSYASISLSHLLSILYIVMHHSDNVVESGFVDFAPHFKIKRDCKVWAFTANWTQILGT